MTHDQPVDRRAFFKTVGAAGAAAALPAALPAEAGAQMPMHHAMPKPAAAMSDDGAQPFVFLTATEAAFLAAAVDVFIPKDDVGPGGVESGCVNFLDRQLASGWGRGARLYLQGPFADGKPEQGYQLQLTPAELYRVGIADVNAWCTKQHGKSFDQLSAAERDGVLKDMLAGKIELARVPARTFAGLLLNNTMEGYFADPIHGGNRDKGSWKMIGFPGAGGVFATEVEEYRNKPYPAEPRSIADLS